MNANIKLYGWEVSPYTAKVDAYLHFKGIPFKKIAPNAYTLARKIQPAVGKMIMPVVYINNNDPIQDSTVIIDYFEKAYPDRPAIPSTPKQKICAQLFELYSDEWLPMAALHYRWNYPENYDFILSEFGKNALPHFPNFIQKRVAKTFAGKMSGYLPILGITPKTQAPLEEHIEELLSLLDKHFSNHRFLLGGQPCLADFSLFGPLYAHLHRDPSPKDLIAKHHNVLNWMERVKGDTSNEPLGFFENDQIPDSLVAVIQHMTNSQMPLIAQTIDAVKHWGNNKQQGDKLPPKLGDAELIINGKKETRYNLSYAYWMFQRIQETYSETPTSEKHDTDNFIASLGNLEILQEPLPYKTTLRNCRLYLAA